MVGFVGEGGGGERDNRLRALRATRPHTGSYAGGRDQEREEIERHGFVPLEPHYSLLQGTFLTRSTCDAVSSDNVFIHISQTKSIDGLEKVNPPPKVVDLLFTITY